MPGEAAATGTGARYDALPYPSRFFSESHPDRLAAMAVLHGVTPPPVAHCRLLELGCADGGNLLAMAQTLPGASFVGVDVSARQVEAGRAAAAALGFGNVDLRAMSLADVDASFGRFDYVVCHGVYSWVPAAVRDAILNVCARSLVPNGVAYVSYNTYPGWHLRGMVRAMMLYHTRGFADPAAQVREARGLLDFLARTATPQDGAYAHVLRQEAQAIEKSRDTYVYHDQLADENHPVYFHEFVAHASAFGLDYLSPARFDIREVNLPAEAAQAVGRLSGDRVRRAQYLDFVLYRTLRQSLLCRAGNAPADGPLPAALRALRLTALARPEANEVDLRAETPAPFVSVFGDRVSVVQPLLKAALLALQARWPRSAGLDELHAAAKGLLSLSWDDPDAFATTLLRAHLANLVDLHTDDPPIAPDPGDRPRAGALARRDAGAGAKVVNLRGGSVALQEVDRLILPLLDGTRDRAAVIDALAGSIADGSLQMNHEGRPVTDPAAARAVLATSVDESFRRLASQAMFLAG